MTKPEISDKTYCSVRRETRKSVNHHGCDGELGDGAVGQVLRADGERRQRHRLPRELRREVSVEQQFAVYKLFSLEDTHQ